MSSLYVIGDAHGQLDKLSALLRSAELVDDEMHWSAGSATLWFTGDFCDRGPHGIEIIELVMRLQREATEAGGKVGALLGNHEIMLLGARRFPNHRATFGSTYHDVWSFNGGRETDREGLSAEQIAWLSDLPAVAVEEGILLLHCDAMFYRRFGSTGEDVNRTVRDVLHGDDLRTWDDLMETYFDRGAFVNARDGVAAATLMLQTFGGNVIVHGHTPIPYLSQSDPASVTEPFVYTDGQCIDVDGGMYLGGPGFVVELTAAASERNGASARG